MHSPLIEHLDDIAHSINCVHLVKNSLVFFFCEDVSQEEIESFFRSFYVQIKKLDGNIKMKSEPLVSLKRRVNKQQLFIDLPRVFPPAKKGDIARIHLFGKRGRDIVL
jgi:hypothetical protein